MKVGDLVKCYLRGLSPDSNYLVGVIVEVKEDETRHINHPYLVYFQDGNRWDCSSLYLEVIQ